MNLLNAFHTNVSSLVAVPKACTAARLDTGTSTPPPPPPSQYLRDDKIPGEKGVWVQAQSL